VAQADLEARAKKIAGREMEIYKAKAIGSAKATEKAAKRLPLGVASNFQDFDPHPLVMTRAKGSHIWDVDGNEYIDYNMGYGALFAGHSHPLLVESLSAQAAQGTLFCTPTPSMADLAEELCSRFPMDMVRFCNSGTEATMDALRLARGYTGRDKIIKVEGAYHGHHDLVMMSVHPSAEDAGPTHEPRTVPESSGTTEATAKDVLVVPFNDLDALEHLFSTHPGEVAAFILEPVSENIGIVLPDEGYLAECIEIAHRHGALVVFDEVKTGITAHYNGAAGKWGLKPDLICLAKSIGGGVPIAAFGGNKIVMDKITDWTVAHQGTFNGNPLVTAASLTVLRDICTEENTQDAIARNQRLVSRCEEIIDKSGLPAHVVTMGAKACITYSPTRIRNYRDFLKTSEVLSYAHWLHMLTHGILLPPGLDEQWLVSVQHTDEDVDRHAEAFASFVEELTK